jgi:hypothetical protein
MEKVVLESSSQPSEVFLGRRKPNLMLHILNAEHSFAWISPKG